MTTHHSHQYSLARRLWIYQKERFPVFAHGPLILAFTYSAVSYSRLSRGIESFIPWNDFWPGLVVAFCLFFLMRVLDEHKDAKNDLRFRSYLPVPRGLISLYELRKIGAAALLLQLAMIVFYHQALWWLYLLMMAYLFLMTVEFFVPKWISNKTLLYMFSHMLIMPLFDLYSSAMDWQLNGNGFHDGIWIFVAVSFFNGTVLEVGRKIRIPEREEPGIKTYSRALGTRSAAVFWLVLITITFSLAFWALRYADIGSLSEVVLFILFLVLALPGLLFLLKPKAKLEKMIELASGLWTLAMYLILGGVPMLIKSLTT